MVGRGTRRRLLKGAHCLTSHAPGRWKVHTGEGGMLSEWALAMSQLEASQWRVVGEVKSVEPCLSDCLFVCKWMHLCPLRFNRMLQTSGHDSFCMWGRIPPLRSHQRRLLSTHHCGVHCLPLYMRTCGVHISVRTVVISCLREFAKSTWRCVCHTTPIVRKVWGGTAYWRSIKEEDVNGVGFHVDCSCSGTNVSLMRWNGRRFWRSFPHWVMRGAHEGVWVCVTPAKARINVSPAVCPEVSESPHWWWCAEWNLLPRSC